MYFEKVNKHSDKDMFYFLNEHFRYFTMNSWNGLKSIANNVKIYNIKELDYDILDYLQADNYTTINDYIDCWEQDHKGYVVGFNGRSGGYLVLYNKDNNGDVLDDYFDNNDYDDFKSEIIRDYGTMKEYHNRLIEQVELVQDFDALCDDLVQVCLDLKSNYDLVNEERTYTETVQVLKEKE